MKIAIHQPQYFPWSLYVHKVMSADIFVYLDTVQFSKNGVQNRNMIKTTYGPTWLTVPVRHAHKQSIRDTEIADPKSTRKHWNTLQANYARTTGFQRWKDELHDLLHQEWRTLAEVAIASTEWMLDKLAISNKRVRASEIPEAHGRKSELIASICEALHGDQYLSGTGGLAYLQPDEFDRIGCKIQIQSWTTFSYPQIYDETGFSSELSALDVLLNAPDSARELIAGAGRWEALYRP